MFDTFLKITTLYILLCKVSPSVITLDLIPILLLQESYAVVHSLLYSVCLLICFKNVHPLFFNFLFFLFDYILFPFFFISNLPK